MIWIARTHSSQSTSQIEPLGPYTPALLTRTDRSGNAFGGQREEAVDRVRVGHVGGRGGDLLAVAARPRQLSLSALEHVRVPAADEDARPLGQERPADRQSQDPGWRR